MHLFPSLPPFMHSTCYFHSSHTMDKCPIQSLGSVQTLSISWLLSHEVSTDLYLLPSLLGKNHCFILVYRTRLFKALLTLTM